MHKPEIVNEQPNAQVIALIILLALLWGGNSVSIKIGLQDIPPLALAGLRFCLGLAFITTWASIQRIPIRLNPGELLPLLLVSVIFISQIIALNVGTNLTLAARSTVLINTYPFFTALFAHFLVPGDQLSLNKTIGTVLAFGGVLLTFADNFQIGMPGYAVADQAQQYIIGDLIVMASGCLLGLRTVVVKRVIQSIHPYRLLIWLMIFSLPCFFGLSLLLERGNTFRLSTASCAAILYQGVVVAGFCFITWTRLLKKYSPSRLVVLFFTTPLFGVLLSYLLLGEAMNVSLILGVGLVACGIYLVNKR